MTLSNSFRSAIDQALQEGVTPAEILCSLGHRASMNAQAQAVVREVEEYLSAHA